MSRDHYAECDWNSYMLARVQMASPYTSVTGQLAPILKCGERFSYTIPHLPVFSANLRSGVQRSFGPLEVFYSIYELACHVRAKLLVRSVARQVLATLCFRHRLIKWPGAPSRGAFGHLEASRAKRATPPSCFSSFSTFVGVTVGYGCWLS